jgi:hypothetical protein
LLNNKARLPFILGVVLALAHSALAVAGGPGFRTYHQLEEHYTKYGAQFGKVSQQQYLRMAQQLRDSRSGRNILEAKRAGGGAKFDKRSGWFVAYDGDGTIRTFFIPRNGVHYFEQHSKSSSLHE